MDLPKKEINFDTGTGFSQIPNVLGNAEIFSCHVMSSKKTSAIAQYPGKVKKAVGGDIFRNFPSRSIAVS
jgi:hypothetical protein